MTNVNFKLQRWKLGGLFAGLAGTFGCGASYFFDSSTFFHGYQIAFFFWWRLTIGFLALALLRCILRSNWGNATWPYLKAGIATLPVIAVLATPMWWGLDEIFPWAGYQHQLHAVQEPADTSVAGAAANQQTRTATSSEATPEDSSETGHHAGSHENAFQEVYFQPSFFLARGIGYFAIWLICGMIAARTGTSTGDARWPRRIAALAIMAVVLASTFAAFDWGMSLEPTWYSTIYGALILMSGVVAAMAVLTMSLIHVFRFPRSSGVGLSAIANDLGNLLLAFLMILAYFAFSQYLIIWSANLPSETSWYLRRSNGGWQTMLLVVVAIQFVVPFFLLLSRDQKRRPRRLARIAALLLIGNVIENVWTIGPSFNTSAGMYLWAFPTALVGIGGWWILGFSTALRRALNSEDLLEQGTP